MGTALSVSPVASTASSSSALLSTKRIFKQIVETKAENRREEAIRNPQEDY
jgi:hypothetical protein